MNKYFKGMLPDMFLCVEADNEQEAKYLMLDMIMESLEADDIIPWEVDKEEYERFGK